MNVKKVAVIGAGLMGHGIAQVSAQVANFDVNLVDVKQEFLDKAMAMINESLRKFVKKGAITEKQAEETLNRIHPTLNLKEAVVNVDLVIEAASENLNLKKSLFAEIEKAANPNAVLTSNTSSISITELASATNRPEKFCGMHFFNSPQLMKLVEVIRGLQTADETLKTVVEAAKKMGKEPITVKKDCPGFVVNRILIPALNEAVSLVWEGVAEPEEIDKAVKLGLNWPMGPLTLLDYLGIDTHFAISEVFRENLGDKYAPPPLAKQMVKAGLLGRKTGKGFYDWTEKNKGL